MHVNADDPEACLSGRALALAYRSDVPADFLIDLIGYRRWGHNEGDEPAFTQPRMYPHDRRAPDGARDAAREDAGRARHRPDAQTAGDAGQASTSSDLQTGARRLQPARGFVEPLPAAPPPGAAAQSADRGAARPARGAERRAAELAGGLQPSTEAGARGASSAGRVRAADRAHGRLGHAETLAFASILADGTPIRLTGQDVERGTFSQRHLVLHDAETRRAVHPAAGAAAGARLVRGPQQPALGERGARLRVRLQRPGATRWCSGKRSTATSSTAPRSSSTSSSSRRRAKWGQPPSLVLLLPHALRGPGPGPLQRPAGALPAAGRRGQPARRQLHDRGAVLPPAAPAGGAACSRIRGR